MRLLAADAPSAATNRFGFWACARVCLWTERGDDIGNSGFNV